MSAKSEHQPWMRPVEPGPTVQKVDALPELQALPPRVLKKVRPGEAFHFGFDVVVEPAEGCGKRAWVSSPLPGAPVFSIYSDEGKGVGGNEAAPPPLAYFTAGVGFCLMTHITGYLKRRPLRINKLSIEMRGNYWTRLGHVSDAGEGEGGCDNFETCVLIDSDEDPELLKEFVAMCEQACIASRTIAAAVPASLQVVVNGQPH